MSSSESDGIVKTGRVELGRTPSVVSGDVASVIEDDEPVVKGEVAIDPGLKKLGSLLPK